jgi:hypothetical protein
VERVGNEEETYFTYEELQRICVLEACRMRAYAKLPAGAF